MIEYTLGIYAIKEQTMQISSHYSMQNQYVLINNTYLNN